MAKTRKRQIKKRGGASCLFVLDGIIDSIGVLIKAIDKVKKITEVEKINEIGSNFYTNVANAFNRQINATCTDITKNNYISLIKHLTRLSAKFEEKHEVFSDDTQGYLTRIETMKTRASELSELIIEPSVSLPNPPQTKSKTVKKKTPTKVVETANFMPPLQHMLPLTPPLTHVAAATAEEKAVKEAKKNAEKKARRALREEAERKAVEEERKAAEEKKAVEEEAARKVDEEERNISEELASASKTEEEEQKQKHLDRKLMIEATVKRLAEKDKKKAEEEALINNTIKSFFDYFTRVQIEPLGIITQDQAKMCITTLFPNVKFTNKITDYYQDSTSTPTQPKINESDSENYMYFSYFFIMYIGLLNNHLYILNKEKPTSPAAGLKLLFKGGRAAQIMLPKGNNLLSDDTDIFIQSNNVYHSPFFLKTFAVELAKSWIKSQQIISGIGKKNPNIVKIAYKSLTGLIPISDIDFGSPTYPQYYDDIRMVNKTWKIISEPIMPMLETTSETKKLVSKITLVYYHQSPKSFFAEKQFIYDMYLNPIYKTCDCGVVPHTEDCIASCSERQFYLDKFKKYVDLESKPPSSNRKTKKNKTSLPL